MDGINQDLEILYKRIDFNLFDVYDSGSHGGVSLQAQGCLARSNGNLRLGTGKFEVDISCCRRDPADSYLGNLGLQGDVPRAKKCVPHLGASGCIAIKIET